MMRLAAIALILATPTVALAQLDSEVRQCASDGSPTFFPRQGRWFAVPDFENSIPFPIGLFIGIEGAPGIGDTSEISAINSALDEYNLQICGATATSYPNIFLLNGGAFDFANQTLGGQPVPPNAASIPLNRRGDAVNAENALVDFYNIIRWVGTDETSSFAGGAQTLAVTSSVILQTTEIAVTADIEFNAINFQWRAGTQGCSSSNSSCQDVFTVAIHEVGHFVGFGHVECADATMYQFHKGNTVSTGITENERVGLCALYPERNYSESQRTFGEQCDGDSDCANGLICALEPGYTSTFGFCTQACERNDQCSTGFICRTHPDGYQFCAPGSDASAPGSGGTVDPGTGRAVDFCQPCTSGAQCSNGICAGPTEADAVCTQGCAAGPGLGCPNGFECSLTDQEFSVCVPTNPAICGGEDSRGALNELCYLPGGAGNGEDFLNPCRPGLACFGFAPICGTSIGACVVYCDAFDRPYNGRACPEPSQTCCFAVDDDGNCIETPVFGTAGGCFDVRSVGETCVVAENAVCQEGARCVAFNGVNSDRCYRDCTSDAECGDGQDCRAFQDGCNNQIAVCCDSSRTDTCVAVAETDKYEVGVACRESDECQSGLCISVAGGQRACSRNCNPVTATECPGDDVDVNGDGTADGPFDCRQLDNQFYCWPENGPVLPTDGGRRITDTGDGGGCCNAAGVDVPFRNRAATLLMWGAIAGLMWFRRRRVRS